MEMAIGPQLVVYHTIKIFCAIAEAEAGQQPETTDVSTAYLEAPEENILLMERADYIHKTDHELSPSERKS
jgi:hypothetical protein